LLAAFATCNVMARFRPNCRLSVASDAKQAVSQSIWTHGRVATCDPLAVDRHL